ncbi:MAG: hypothetical protein CMJ65_12645 [Planctomycetaceae bacterium]|jgi:hypothetical protein|nr:hypothetical protein [Planctomycetaceae bacterium]MDP7276129.1 DUF1501 domain-containing protein [Planctomycetaceae bacterium]
MHDPVHSHDHAFTGLNPRVREGLVINNRRSMLKASLAGMAGLSLPGLLQSRAEAVENGQAIGTGKSVILLWMAGGPSHIDTWDPKPDRPFNNRGPFGVTQTAQPGVIICEHLPKQAAMLDKFTIIRSVDPKKSSHEPNMVLQTGNRAAAPRTNPKGRLYPAIGSVVSKFHGPNHPSMPAYATFMRSRSHLAFAGYLGKQYDPFVANLATRLPVYTKVGVDTGQVSGANLLQIPTGLTSDRLRNRQSLADQFDRLRRDLDQSGSMNALDAYQQKAVEMVLGQRARKALDINLEPEKVRQRFGKHLWCQQTLLARRLIQAGVSFVTLDLSYHTASGTWDTHGDNIPPYGGISKGLGPLLPLFDHLITTLVGDLDDHGLLEDCLVIAMGEFGRTPNMGTQGSTDGRNHYTSISSLSMAGGGLEHGQVIGASEHDGGHIKERPVTPGDLAATIYRHMQVPLDTTYLDNRGRPNNIVIDGEPIRELF